MNAKPRGPKRRAEDNDDVSPDVQAALRSLGWTAPQCEEDVLAAESELATQRLPLPEKLQDPKAVFDGATEHGETPPSVLRFPGDPDIDATLARAAREGGHITPEIEEVMRRDREAAEREMDNGEETE